MPNSDNATETTLQLYTVPQRIQTKALDLLQEMVLDGREMADGNNPTTFLLEFASTLAAGITNEMSQTFSALYPSRALTTSDLYRHMSDYDYVNLFSTPSTTTISVALNRDYLILNAVRYGNTDYKKIVIPEYSTFKIGEYQFGIHYPIEIQIKEARKNGSIDYDNCLISTQWDLSNENPLMLMESNVIENRTYMREGINLLCLSIPVHQFTATLFKEDTVASTGFTKRYEYPDKFYAARIFHYYKGEWVELAQTLSDIVYDPDVATVKLSVLVDINTLQIDIPQVYFSRNQIGSKIRVYLYTTKGKLDLDISAYSAEQFTASFLFNDEVIDDTYSSMLKRIPYCQVVPLAKRINGGSDGLTFQEMRDRVVHDSTYTLLITMADIANYFQDQGFIAKRYIDNLTNRIYLAQKVMTDKTGVMISAGDETAVFHNDVFHHVVDEETGYTEVENYRTIKYINDRSYMILPTTVYKYDQGSNTVTPMDNAWMDRLDDMSAAEKVELLNSGLYTYTPFHLKLTVTNTVPVASYYDLMDPKITKTTFVDENTNITSQISIYSSSIVHMDNGTGGYRLVITLYKTSDLDKVTVLAEDGISPNIQLVLKTETADGESVYMYGQYAGTINGRDAFVFDFSTTYRLNENDELDISSFNSMTSGLNTTVDIPLVNEYKLMFFVARQYIPSVLSMVGVDVSQFPPDMGVGGIVWLATQKFTLSLGEAINTLFTNVSVNVESQQYQRYPTTVYATYTSPVYERYTLEDVGTGESTDEYYGKITEAQVGLYKYPLKLVHDEGEVILDPVADETIPPACTLQIYREDEETGETVEDNYPLYLQEVYTSTSQPTNVWKPPTDKFKAYNKDNKWSIEIVDVLKYALDDIGEESNTKGQVASYKDLRIKFRDKTVKVGGKSVKTKESYDPHAGQMFMFVKDATGDYSTPENEFLLTEPKTEKKGNTDVVLDSPGYAGALYRRNPEYTNFDYTQYQYRLATDPQAKDLTAEVLEQIYAELDSTNDHDAVARKYSIAKSVLNKLKTSVRSPWIKVISAENSKALKDYWEGRKINNNKAADIFAIQQKLGRIPAYATWEDLTKANGSIKEGDIVWVEDITGANGSKTGSLLKDLPVTGIQTQGALVQKKNSGWTWIITGPYKMTCVAAVISVNTFSGFAYLIKNDTTKRYLMLVSYDQGDILNIDYKSFTWAEVDRWPWEIARHWVDVATGTNAMIDVDMDLNTSAKVAQHGGDVELDENGNLIGVITDMNGDPIPEDDEYADTRQIIYNVRTLQVDYKLLFSTEAHHLNYRQDVLELLRSYFSTINTARASLLERTDLYFSPIRTMGYAEFKGTNAEVETMSLDITMGFRLYVQGYVANSADNRDAIMNNVLSIIDTHLAAGSISTTQLAEEIRTSLSDTVQFVENLGINGDPELRILILNESMEECIPHLKQQLYLDDANQIKVNRGVMIEYVSID